MSDLMALVGDDRNDENTIVAQTHVVILDFNNRIVDRLIRGEDEDEEDRNRTRFDDESVNAKVVSGMLNHAPITITLNTYSHVLPGMQNSTVDAMETALGSIS